MAAAAAYTGARRSELIRMRVADIDFEANVVVIREKKRVRGRLTTKRVPLARALGGVLEEYLKSHPGGHVLFCHAGPVDRSRTRSRAIVERAEQGAKKTMSTDREKSETRGEGTVPLTPDEAHDHLRRTLSGSKWAVIRGWHVFRHSFVSACASKGVDQRLLQTWCGHMSAETSARYSHLYPSTQQISLDSVFG
jgi:integrase